MPKRFFFPQNHSKETYDIWIHVCSFGEVNSLQKIIESIPKTKQIFLTTITNTGYLQAQKLYGNVENIHISYLAFETLLPFVAPKCEKLFVFEAELWLMLFFIAKSRGANTKLINARISTRSINRYQRLRFFYKKLFSYVDSTLAQSEIDKTRLESIGAKNVEIIGNIKALNDIIPTKFYTKPNRLVILCASTHANKPLSEEEAILQELAKLRNAWGDSIESKVADTPPFAGGLGGGSKEDSIESANLQNLNSKDSKNNDFIPHNFSPTSHITKTSENPLIILAPRHPERFEQVYNIAKKYFKTLKFSRLIESKSTEITSLNFDNLPCEVLLIDTLGELINLYNISDIVLLGGAWAKKGGHNPLEVATFKNVLLSGKEIFNQEALFACVENYYLIDLSEIHNILKNYNALYTAQIAMKKSDIIDKILS